MTRASSLDRIFWCSSSLQPTLDSGPVNAKFPGPFGNGLRASKRSNHVVVAAIAILLAGCRPYDVARFIVTIVVKALNGMMSGWARTHVGKKIGEFKPTITDLNTASAISRVAILLGIQASALHPVPNLVGWRQAGHSGIDAVAVGQLWPSSYNGPAPPATRVTVDTVAVSVMGFVWMALASSHSSF
jgi:hypothetical protein